MVKLKDLIGGILILVFIVFFIYLFYDSTENIYQEEINDTVVDIKSNSKLGHEFLLSREQIYTSFFSDDSNLIKIGDSIVKKRNSVEYKIFRKSQESNKKEYYKSVYVKKSLSFYNFIVKIEKK